MDYYQKSIELTQKMVILSVFNISPDNIGTSLLKIIFILDGHNCGDYPHLEDKPVEQRDPFYPYDHPEHRRNFEETV